jgi:hypothetical protein
MVMVVIVVEIGTMMIMTFMVMFIMTGRIVRMLNPLKLLLPQVIEAFILRVLQQGPLRT